MKALLQKSCKECTASSIETYFWTIKSLAKIAGLQDVPTNERWITAALLQKVKQQKPLTRSKNLAVAGIKALRAYGNKTKLEPWNKYVTEVSERYSKIREKQERTDREAKNWPKGGYAAISKLADELHGEVTHLFKKAPARITFPELWKLGRWFVFLFYSKHALRGDLADVQIKKRGQNYVLKKGKHWHMHVGEHKTARSHGAIEIKLDTKVSQALDLFLPYVRAKTSHGFLLSTQRHGKRLSRRDMMKLIRNTTEDRLGKRIGIQMLRVMKTTSRLKGIDEAEKLRREMAHGPNMQWKYVSRA